MIKQHILRRAINHQKNVARKVLDKLKLIDQGAICAGGAPRDWYFSKKATDIDFFIYCPSLAGQAFMLRTLKYLLNDSFQTWGEAHNWDVVDRRIPEIYKGNPELMWVFEGKVQNQTIQIMVMRSPTYRSVIPNFPYGICQAWYAPNVYNGEGEILTTHGFDASVRDKTLYRTAKEIPLSDKYRDKIQGKFLDYALDPFIQ